jgi:hypothetical protein
MSSLIHARRHCLVLQQLWYRSTPPSHACLRRISRRTSHTVNLTRNNSDNFAKEDESGSLGPRSISYFCCSSLLILVHLFILRCRQMRPAFTCTSLIAFHFFTSHDSAGSSNGYARSPFKLLCLQANIPQTHKIFLLTSTSCPTRLEH